MSWSFICPSNKVSSLRRVLAAAEIDAGAGRCRAPGRGVQSGRGGGSVEAGALDRLLVTLNAGERVEESRDQSAFAWRRGHGVAQPVERPPGVGLTVARTTRRRGQGFSLLALAAVCALVAAAAGEGSRPAAQPQLVSRTVRAAASKSPSPTPSPANTSGFPPLPSGYGNTYYGAQFTPVTQDVKRAKVNIAFPQISMMLMEKPTRRPGTARIVWYDVDGLMYVGSPRGSQTPFGEFPALQVKVLAFGMVPVTAVLHLSQPLVGDQPRPFHLTFSFDNLAEDGRTNWQDLGPLSVDGEIDVRVSDVVVDRVPINVGSNCRTIAPATLTVAQGPGTFSPYLGSRLPVDQARMPPSLYVPAAQTHIDPSTQQLIGGPGTLRGLVDVPRFTGCTNGDEDFSPLLSAMVSGPGNPISLTQPLPLGVYVPPTY